METNKEKSNEMSISDFSYKVIGKFNKRITNEIFLFIQNDRELMYDYLKLVEKYRLKTVNQNIGKAVKKAYKLDNLDDDREENPACTLIQTHTKFE